MFFVVVVHLLPPQGITIVRIRAESVRGQRRTCIENLVVLNETQRFSDSDSLSLCQDSASRGEEIRVYVPGTKVRHARGRGCGTQGISSRVPVAHAGPSARVLSA